MATATMPPGPKGHFLLGALPDIRRDELDYLTDIVRRYGDVVYLRVVNHPCYVLSHPRDIEYVLLTNYGNFKKSIFLRASQALFGNGLLTSDGDFWLRQRRLLQPAFHHESIAAYSRAMVEHTGQELAAWQDGEVRDVHQDMMRLTMQIVGEVLFGDNISADIEDAGEALRVFFEQFDERFGLYAIPEWLPTPANLRYRQAMRRLDRILEKVIRARQTNGGPDRPSGGHASLDLLSTLMRLQDENGTGMTEKQLRDELMTLFFTGHETTGLALGWTWHLVAQHPEAGDRLFQEVEQVLGGRTPTFQDIPKMQFVDFVIKESLRLYPPAYGVVRQAVNDCEIGGYTIPAGATVAMFPWSVHRDPRYFDRPEEFLPERWAGGFEKSLPRCAYFPFSVGPRVCIGNTFALTELALLVAMIAQRFRFEPVAGHPVLLNPSLTLRPRKGIKLRVKNAGAQDTRQASGRPPLAPVE
jgi:cytochrome P450